MAVFTWKDVQPASSAGLFDAMARSNAQATKAKEGIFDAITQYSKDRQGIAKNQMMMDMLQAGEDPTAQQAIFDKYSQHSFAPESEDIANVIADSEDFLSSKVTRKQTSEMANYYAQLAQAKSIANDEAAQDAAVRAAQQARKLREAEQAERKSFLNNPTVLGNIGLDAESARLEYERNDVICKILNQVNYIVALSYLK